jgi:hypothetical protein
MDLMALLHLLKWDTPAGTVNMAFGLLVALAVHHSMAYKTRRARQWVVGTYIVWGGIVFVMTYHIEAFQDGQAKLSLPVTIILTTSAVMALGVTGVCIAYYRDAACLALATFTTMTGLAVMCWMYHTQNRIAMGVDLYKAWLLLEATSLVLAAVVPFWMLGGWAFERKRSRKVQLSAR